MKTFSRALFALLRVIDVQFRKAATLIGVVNETLQASVLPKLPSDEVALQRSISHHIRFLYTFPYSIHPLQNHHCL